MNAHTTAATAMHAPVRASGGSAVGRPAARITLHAYAIIATSANRNPANEIAGMPPSPTIASATPATATTIPAQA